MIIKDARLYRTAYSVDEFVADDRIKLLFIGRSNVGKSSLINKIVNRKDMARTSSKPGKTVSINYYLINHEFYFVDLPGYGYAKISKSEAQRVQTLMNQFLARVTNVKLVLLLIDCRRGFMDSDMEILKQILQKNYKILTILTKSDKISYSELNSQKSNLQKTFGLKTISFSTKSNNKREEILGLIKNTIAE